MDIDVSLWVKLRRLLAALQLQELGYDELHQAAGNKQLKTSSSGPVCYDFVELISDPLGAHPCKKRGMLADGAPRRRVNFKSRSGGKPYGSDKAKSVLRKSFMGSSNRSQNASFEIIHSAHIVYNFSSEGIFKESVNGEIPSPCIILCISKDDRFWAASIEIRSVGTKGGDFEIMTTFSDKDDSEMSAYFVAARKELENLLRCRRGCDIVVRRGYVE